MIALEIYKNDIIIGYGGKVVFIDTENTQFIKEVHDIFESIAQARKNENKNVLAASLSQQELEEKSNNKSSCNIQHIKVSPNHEYLAVTTRGQKYLLFYKIQPSITNSSKLEKLELLSVRNMARASSAITFSNDSNSLFVCDKSGDCYLYDCNNVFLPGKWILGHFSIVLDVIFTPNQKYIITCDRDEKIRITNFPDTHEIQCYCLGHEEFVSSISLLYNNNDNYNNNSDDYLLSLSGDKTIKIWNYKNGEKLCDAIQLELPGIKHSIYQFDLNSWHIAVILYEPITNKTNKVCLYEIKNTNTNIDDSIKFESNLLTKFNYDKKNITNIKFNQNNGKLYLIMVDEKQVIDLEILQYDDKSKNYESSNQNDLKSWLRNSLKDFQINEVEDVSLWFKKKFDNVSEYLARKKRRIEEKSK